MIDRILEFIDKYYIYPIVEDAGYNPVNTITWAILLVLFLFISLKILQKLDINLDRGFVYSLVPFVFIGSGLRVVEDAGVVEPPFSYALITPLIYFLVALITLFVLVAVSIAIKNGFLDRDGQNKMVFIVGCVLAGLLAAYLIFISIDLPLVRPSISFEIVVATLTITGVAFYLARWYGFKLLLDNIYLLIFGSHIFDASSTFVGFQYGATEKHVLPAFLIDLTGTSAVMFPLKIVVVLLVLWLVDSIFTEEEDSELKALVLLAILVLGLAPALRNTLRLTLGV
ncbi:DUF63 family protein [Methanonatronarchaeum sp. AMET6-2]|uniref:DUF63 family protein n=1 Tax=Methanonatronarchaeum sp. AMET6-2 TaxID=2933293 RepID=UPI0012234663|nr:DUF63 family protein [Methanonatronarchaeum sp. AMET6-2]RZN61916.1 MAG: DUF63 family protein [Methanonatronarchaeia archaeon]UOY10645.1 DUF63 family protein [Methanonatronarchaeum sp. AMET6-2]